MTYQLSRALVRSCSPHFPFLLRPRQGSRPPLPSAYTCPRRRRPPPPSTRLFRGGGTHSLLSPRHGRVRDDIPKSCGGDDPRGHPVATSAGQRALLPLSSEVSSATTSPTDVRVALSAESDVPSAAVALSAVVAPASPAPTVFSGKPSPTAVRADSPAETKTPRPSRDLLRRGGTRSPSAAAATSSTTSPKASRKSRGLICGDGPRFSTPPAASFAATYPRPSSTTTAHGSSADGQVPPPCYLLASGRECSPSPA